MLILAALPLFADPPEPVVVNATTDRYRPLAFDQQKLSGLLAKRMRANTEGYLEHVDVSRADGGLNGQAGELLEASANAFEFRHDEHLRTVMDRLAQELTSARSAVALPAAESSAEPADWQELENRKHAVLGLLAYYRVSRNESALDGARKIADEVVREFPKNATARGNYLRAATLIEPLTDLYAYTEESRYLELCRSAAEAWLQSKDSHSDTAPENISVLQGLVELYRVTGEEAYFRGVPQAWAQVRDKGLTIAGAPIGSGDNACGMLAWTQLTLNLLRMTGEARYGEQLERTIYNRVFAGQDPNTGVILQPVPLNGSKQPAADSDSCAASEALAIAQIPGAVWGRYGNGIAVLLYNAGRATFQLSRRRGTVQLYSEATFPEGGDYLLHVEPAHNLRFPLRLRVPEWTSEFTADIAGSHLSGKPGDFLIINREWRPGDTVKISMDMSLQLVAGSGEFTGQVAVQRGPQVLALGRAVNPQLTDLGAAALVPSDSPRPKLMTVAGKQLGNWSEDQIYAVNGEYEGKLQQLELAPFADVRVYRVWLRKAAAASGGTN